MKANMTEKEMKQEAACFIRRILKEHAGEGALVVGLEGELGAGKTTFVQAIARELGIRESVTSPTFVIEKIYAVQREPFSFFIHIDAYRLASCDEMRHIGWDEIKNDPKNVVCIEWADRVRACLPETCVWVNLDIINETERCIRYENKKREKK